MATNGNTPQKPNLGLAPAVEQLNNHFILGEMINNLSTFNPAHPTVDFDVLVDWLTHVQDHRVDLESTMRKLLKTFVKTEAYKDQFEPLEAETQDQIKAFIKGTGAEDVVAEKGFRPKPSPSSQHRFRGLDSRLIESARPAVKAKPAKKSFWTWFQNLIGSCVQKIEHDDQDPALDVPSSLEERNKLFSKRWGGGDKVVYEDIQKTLVMEVQTLISGRMASMRG
jgi:hypothetical protein